MIKAERLQVHQPQNLEDVRRVTEAYLQTALQLEQFITLILEQAQAEQQWRLALKASPPSQDRVRQYLLDGSISPPV